MKKWTSYLYIQTDWYFENNICSNILFVFHILYCSIVSIFLSNVCNKVYTNSNMSGKFIVPLREG